MFVVHHQTADTFLARAQSTLEQHEAANNLMIGIAVRLQEFPERIKTPPYLATIEDGERLVAAAVMTPPHRLILHAEGDDPAPLRLLAHDLVSGGWPVPGVGALEGHVQGVCRDLGRCDGPAASRRHERACLRIAPGESARTAGAGRVTGRDRG